MTGPVELIASAGCGGPIPERADHYVARGRIRCAGCFTSPAAHELIYPACRIPGHDVHDHAYGRGPATLAARYAPQQTTN